MKNSIILFRFHDRFDVSKQRIELLTKQNPSVPIFGLFGGNKSLYEKAQSELSDQLIDIYLDKHDDPQWKWLHPDLSLKDWFRNFGKNIHFDFIYDYEWDIATFDALVNIYPATKSNTLYFSGVKYLTSETKILWDWTGKEPHKSQYEKFSRYMKSTYGVEHLDIGTLGPAPLLSREFLEQFSESEDIDWVISEISYPAYAQAFGYNIVDNTFHPGWFSDDAKRYFNCNDDLIQESTMIEEFKKIKGRKIFHPFKEMFSNQLLIQADKL